ncbi:restriction endonuclease [Kineococcus radiotolerans]|uniref:Restriction endonuclease n=1 Tax=Kineococcus radiotolerans (strain ATCC BAA-149 / DSM 14245 / SRS30216) TaxID=266940 RepID=A6WB01_KINRD|nr:restriction endonuclease [Kineococcus radiotolerans]ABS03990.1 restriction endonuclease [Kineococcus radiotolerans SRS30216 = ATCC BAA-149]
MARNQPTRRRAGRRRGGSGSSDDAARLAVAGVVVLILTGAAGAVRSWLAIWWPILALTGAVLIVLLVWRLVVLHRRARARAAHQALLDRQVASTDGMSGPDFEHLVARLLHRDGWQQVTVSGGGGDLGADVTARHPHDGSLLVVQGKRYTDRAVSSPDMQRFLGTVYHHHHAEHALYVTTSRYTRPAHDLATSSGVRLVDRETLAPWMAGQPLPLPVTAGSGRGTAASAHARRPPAA